MDLEYMTYLSLAGQAGTEGGAAAPAAAGDPAAQTTTGTEVPSGDGGAPAQRLQGSPYTMWVWFAIILGFMWFFMIRPQQRAQRKREEMWSGLKIHDRIITAGGIIGVITDIDADRGIVTLRVDDSNNVKVKFLTSAVSQVVTDDEKDKKED